MYTYKENELPDMKQLIELYQSAGWAAYALDPMLLKRCYEKFVYMVTVWDQRQLIGAMRAVGDEEYFVKYNFDLFKGEMTG